MAIGTRLAAQLPELQPCYDAATALDPALKGRWTLTFTIAKDGSAKAADARGLDRKDAPSFEGCLVHQVEAWKFEPLTAEVVVQRTVTFGS